MAKREEIEHFYLDFVDQGRVDKFADASREDQALVLSYLRGASASKTVEQQLAYLAILFSVIAVGIASASASIKRTSRAMTDLLDALLPDPGIRIVVNVILIVGGLILLLLMVGFAWALPLYNSDLRRRSATMWLAAYQDELALRHAAKGREARRWQRAHPINWSS